MVEIEGIRSESEWCNAIKKLQAHHPVMSAAIHKKPGERPEYFNHGKVIKPNFFKWTPDLSIENEMMKTMQESFGNQTDIMFRFNIYQNNDKTFIGGIDKQRFKLIFI